MNKPEKTSLKITRFINAPPARVYNAWTDPEQFKQWCGPENVRTRNITADVRVGGKYRWDLTSPEGEEMSVFGEYRELVPGKKIVFTWKWDDDENWRTHTVSSQLNYSIATVAPKCDSSTSNCRVKNRAIATTRAGTAFSID